MSGDGERVHDALELLADTTREGRRRSAHAADLATAVEIMRTVQRDILNGFAPKKEQRDPKHGGILLLCSTAHALDARIVGDVLFVLKCFSALDLPASSAVVDVVQAIADECQC